MQRQRLRNSQVHSKKSVTIRNEEIKMTEDEDMAAETRPELGWQQVTLQLGPNTVLKAGAGKTPA